MHRLKTTQRPRFDIKAALVASPKVKLNNPYVQRTFSYISLRSNVQWHPSKNFASPSKNFAYMMPRYFSGSTIIPVPSMGDSITEGVINKWQKNIGDQVARDEVVVIIDTDKVSVDVTSPETGVLLEQRAEEGDAVDVGAPLFVLEKGGSPAVPKPEEGASEEKTADVKSDNATVVTEGSPPPQESAAPASTDSARPPAPPATKPAPASSSSPAGSSSKEVVVEGGGHSRTEYRVKMSPIRKRIAARLKEAQNTAASLTTFNEVDMGNLMAIRTEVQDQFVKRHGVKLGLMSPFIYASARALKKMAACNSQIEGTDIVNRDYVDISVAVATPNGLLVPVMKDCDRKSIAELECELGQLAKRARDNKITLEELAGGTFTISNGGVFGSMMGTPILNPPQSAILGMHGINNRPVARGKDVVIRPMMYLALTYDHRIVDGREAVLFLKQIKDYIENPHLLLFD